MLTIPCSLLFTFQLVTASVINHIAERPAPTVEELALITPSPSTWDPTRTRELLKRDILSDVKQDVGNVLSELGSKIPAYVASGVPNFFQDFPTGDKVESSLGIDDSQVSALPTQVLNIPYVIRRSILQAHSAYYLSAVTGIGLIKAGTYVSMAMSISNLTSPFQNWMILQISFSLTPLLIHFSLAKLIKRGT